MFYHIGDWRLLRHIENSLPSLETQLGDIRSSAANLANYDLAILWAFINRHKHGVIVQVRQRGSDHQQQ